MHALIARDLITVWETGVDQLPVDRALTILEASCPERHRDELAQLSIGRRDALLLAIREQTFGPTLNSLVTCPSCGAEAEFSFSIKDLSLAVPDDHPGPVYELTVSEPHRVRHFRYRLPNSIDLAAIAGCADVDEARRRLAMRCVLEGEELPEGALGTLEDEMAGHDPHADLEFDLTCPSCGYRWQALFDIAPFFWTEISAQATRLLREIDALARSYAWSEADILAMSPARRRYYLELVL